MNTEQIFQTALGVAAGMLLAHFIASRMANRRMGGHGGAARPGVHATSDAHQ